MTPFEIREAVESDAEALQAYVARIFAERLPVLFEGAVERSLDEQRALLREMSDPSKGVNLVAVSGETIVGFLDFRREKRPQAAHGGQFGLSVASERRHQGIGTALIGALITWARASSVTRIELQVWENNPTAIRLYERLGFQTEGRRRGAVVVDGTALDVLLMAWAADS